MKHNRSAILALLLVAAAWGSSFTLIKQVLARIPPEPFLFWRFLVAGLFLLVIAALRKQLTRALLRPGAVLGLLVWAGYWAQTRGLLFVSPSRSAFLTGLYVVMVPFADRVVYRVRVPGRAWIASLVALAGTATLIGGFDARPNAGDLLTIACAACFALHVVLSAKWSAEQPAIGLAAVQILAVALLAAPTIPFAAPARFSGEAAAVVLVTAIVTTALAFVALMWGQARVTATEAAVILAFEPVAAAITSVLWYGEPMTRALVVGGLLVLAAMVLSQTPGRAGRPIDSP